MRFGGLLSLLYFRVWFSRRKDCGHTSLKMEVSRVHTGSLCHVKASRPSEIALWECGAVFGKAAAGEAERTEAQD